MQDVLGKWEKEKSSNYLAISSYLYFSLLRFFKKGFRYTQNFLDGCLLFFLVCLPFEADEVQILQR